MTGIVCVKDEVINQTYDMVSGPGTGQFIASPLRLFRTAVREYSVVMGLRLFTALVSLIQLTVLCPARAEPSLVPPEESAEISRLLAERLPRDHVTHFPLDEVISGKAWDSFLSGLDHDRIYFLASDILSFKACRSKIGEKLKDGDVSTAYEIFTVWKERVTNRCAYVRTLVEKGFELDRKETVERDREHAAWSSDEAVWNEVWRKRIKNEYVQRVVKNRLEKGDKAAAEDSAIGASIVKAYNDHRETIEKTEAQRVLEIYLASFSRAYDPHCEYMSPASTEAFNIEMKLSFAGIGAILATEDGIVRVERLIPGGPADRDTRGLALKPGEKIIAVAEGDGEAVDVRHLPVYKVSQLVRGKKGTRVVLTVISAEAVGEAGARKVDLIRDEVKMEDHAAKSEMISLTNAAGTVTKLALVKLPAFYTDMEGRMEHKTNFTSSSSDVGKILLKARNEGVKGVILDLRNNGGGSLGEAVQMAGLFIKEGPVVQVREGTRVNVLVDDDRTVAYSGPLILLVNRYSASASELVAGALQDYGRAVIVGDTRTHGKGTVQTVMPLGKNAKMGSLKVTTGLFYRPTGNSTQLKGVTSDIVIPSPQEYAVESGEDHLPNALEWSMIGEQSIVSCGDLKPVIAELEKRSFIRRASYPKFDAYTNVLERLAAIYQTDTVSLNSDECLDLAKTIRGLNEQLHDTDGKDVESGHSKKAAWDPVKEEAVSILADMVEISGPSSEVSFGAEQGCPASLVSDDIPPDIEKRIEVSIRELGDRSFTVRQRAASELRKIGYTAIAALEAAARSDDPEVASTASSILKDARLGVSATWPESIVQEIRKYDVLGAGARDSLIRRIVSEVKADAVPFLLVRLSSGDNVDGQSVCRALKESNDNGIAGRLVKKLKEPRNEWQARALAWAYQCQKQPQEALRVLVACRVEGEPRQSVIEQAVVDLCSKFKKKEFDEVAKVARDFAQAAPAEARFLYLHAAALRGLNREKEAVEFEGQARKLNTKEEAPHYVTGEMLLDLGLDDLSTMEWAAILKIDPVGDVYDINAWMRLGQIAARGRRNIEAARCYEAGLNLYRKRKAGGHGGYGMIGISEEGLDALIIKLRADGGAAGGMVAGQRGMQIRLHIQTVVKNGKQKELLMALASSQASMVVTTEPLGIRVLDLKEGRLAYDKKTENISILLNGSDACKPRHCPLVGKKTKVAVVELDCVYIFEIDPDSGEVNKSEKFEKDYEVTIKPDENLSGYKGIDLKIGDKMYLWMDLLKGTIVDYLPPVLELRMEGPGDAGSPECINFRIPLDEKDFEAAKDAP